MAVTTTKQVVVQIPTNNPDATKAQWMDSTATPFATTEERAVIMPVAKAEARLNAGRVLLRTITEAVDAKTKAVTTTTVDTVEVKPSTEALAITLTLSEWARVRQCVAGQPWAEGLVATIDAKLGTD